MSGEPTVVTSATRHRPHAHARSAGLFFVAALVAPLVPWELAQAQAVEADDSRSYSVGDGAELTPSPTAEDAAAWDALAGIPTWVSLEPVLDPAVALEIIRQTHPFVDLFKVGKLNYHPLAKSIDWPQFARDAVTLLKSLGKAYYVKNDLSCYL